MALDLGKDLTFAWGCGCRKGGSLGVFVKWWKAGYNVCDEADGYLKCACMPFVYSYMAPFG